MSWKRTWATSEDLMIGTCFTTWNTLTPPFSDISLTKWFTEKSATDRLKKNLSPSQHLLNSHPGMFIFNLFRDVQKHFYPDFFEVKEKVTVSKAFEYLLQWFLNATPRGRCRYAMWFCYNYILVQHKTTQQVRNEFF